jgi:hypothetical protein
MMFYLEFHWQKTCKEFVKWKAITDHRLTEIIASVKNLQVFVGSVVTTLLSFKI